tara:strand:- start:271 stop:657 length:387 start_codon:yes stop_codon:yes gene_type:complete
MFRDSGTRRIASAAFVALFAVWVVVAVSAMRFIREQNEEAGRTEPFVDELRTFVVMIVQTDELGGDIGGVLRAQALASRTRRRQAAQKKALQAPVKMVFPLVLFILPATFVVILGLAALQILPMVLGS